MKFLFQNNIVIVHVGRIPMMFKVVLDHFVGDVARAPCPISNGPKMAAPVFLGKSREFLLQTTRCPSLETLHKIAQLLRRTVFDVYVNMVLAYDTLKDPYIFRITDLIDKVTAPDLDIALENMVTIFRDPYDMGGQPGYRVTGPSLLVSHSTNIEKCVATESLALKCIVSTNGCDQ